MTRVLIPIGLLVAALGGWLVFRGGDDAKPAESEQATATERAPARGLPSNQAHVRTPYWKKNEVRAATTGTPDTAGTGTATPTEARAPDEVRTQQSAQAVLQRPRPGTDPKLVTDAEIDRAVARAEAKGEPLTKERRMELEKQLAARKQPQQDRVPGASQMRDLREKATCTAPDAQQKYAAMSDADKLRMRQRCGKYGFVPAS